MIHGDLKGVRLLQLQPPILPTLSTKANILIDQTGHARLADFGLVTVISDATNSSNSSAQGGTVRWMSPELIDPSRFGLEKVLPTVSSDCYSLGMVVYETVTGRVPFYEHRDFAVAMKIFGGERPPREASFTDRLWKMLELCWDSQSEARPSIEEVLRCLKMELPSPRPRMKAVMIWAYAVVLFVRFQILLNPQSLTAPILREPRDTRDFWHATRLRGSGNR